MADVLPAFAEAVLDGSLTGTGRWVLSVFGLKSNVFAEALLGLLVWILVICLCLALLASLV